MMGKKGKGEVERMIGKALASLRRGIDTDGKEREGRCGEDDR